MIKESVFSLIILSVSMVGAGQDIDLQNVSSGKSQSKTIYIGTQNKFKMTGFRYLQKIDPVSPIISIHEDTIIMSPNQVGTFYVTFHTLRGKQEVVFNSKSFLIH
jgi:hypothetical protein